MSYKVTVHKDVEFPNIVNQYAKALENWKNTDVLPDNFGNEGKWEQNPRLCASHVYKIHIRLPGEVQWKKTRAQLDRTSDHYLVYSVHWTNFEKLQIISIMSPNGHDIAKTSFMAVLEKRAEDFQNN